MIAAQRHVWAMLACIAAAAASLTVRADTTTFEDVDGIRYQVTKRTMQVPIQQASSQQQTVYTQQVSTQTIQQQQLYSVPVTQYQLVSTLHGRWNPFVTPYWTHEYQPVTTWQQQTATVQIPVQTMAWVPQTQTVPTQTTTYRPVEAIVSRIPIGAAPGANGSQQMIASTSPGVARPSATLAARPSAAPSGSVPMVATAPSNTTYGSSAPSYGGTVMNQDPPRQPTAYGATTGDARYNDSTHRY
jgi:hypothetical protein